MNVKNSLWSETRTSEFDSKIPGAGGQPPPPGLLEGAGQLSLGCLEQDMDGNGTISLEELRRGLEAMGSDMDLPTVQVILACPACPTFCCTSGSPLCGAAGGGGIDLCCRCP